MSKCFQSEWLHWVQDCERAMGPVANVVGQADDTRVGAAVGTG